MVKSLTGNEHDQNLNYERGNMNTNGKESNGYFHCKPSKDSTDSDGETEVHTYYQWIATFAIFLLWIVAGVHMGWPSPNFARFNSNSSEVPVTLRELPWLASSDAIGTIAGGILGPLSLEFFGPKQTCLASFLFFSVNWICIMAAKNYVLLMVARFIGGVSLTAAGISSAMYLGEVSSHKLRGTLISIATTGAGVGTLLGTFLETYLTAKLSCPIYLIQCGVGIALLTLVLPESPYFLTKSRKVTKTVRSIKLYFPNEELEEKLSEIKKFVEKETSFSLKDRLKLLKTAPVNKSFMLVVLLFSFIQCSGIMNMFRFMGIILERANSSSLIDPAKLVIYINILSILFKVVTCNVADAFGRKFLLVGSSILVTLSLLSLGIYFYLQNLEVSLIGLEWFPPCCIFLFLSSFSVGFHPAYQTVMSEILPLNVKSIVASLAFLTGSFFDSILTAAFLPIFNDLGEQYILWVHAISGFLVTPLVIFYLPETKGKTLEEIQKSLM